MLTKQVRDPFTFIDLFAGIGGLRLGFEAAGGGRCVFTSEWDRFSRKPHIENHGDDHQFIGDIVPFSAEEVPDHDILLAGFPCQPFSIAGVSKKNALGRAHGFECTTQGTLFFDVARIIAARRPRAFLLENVRNLRSHDKGRTFGVILDTLQNEFGYHVSWKIVDVQGFAPQHRERICIVGYRDAVPFSLDGLVPTGSSPRLGSILHRTDGDEPVLEWDGNRYFDHEFDRVASRFTLSDHLWAYLQDYARKHRAAGNGFGFGLVNGGSVSRTLSARYHKDGSEILVEQALGQNPRRLTPRECASLMGFPDTFRIPVSDTQAYRQFGKSVVVPVVTAVARLMVASLDATRDGTAWGGCPFSLPASPHQPAGHPARWRIRGLGKIGGNPVTASRPSPTAPASIGNLSQRVAAVASKRLSIVETDSARSHQHEFNGDTGLIRLFGRAETSQRFPARFLYLSDDPLVSVTDDGFLTWHDARAAGRERGIDRTEHRLYFKSNSVSGTSKPGDRLFIARMHDQRVIAVVTKEGSTAAAQLVWLFGLDGDGTPRFQTRVEDDLRSTQTSFAVRRILEIIGTDTVDDASDWLSYMIHVFGTHFPTTQVFSDFARETLATTDWQADPDQALLDWMAREEALFRALERHIVNQKLQDLASQGPIEADAAIELGQRALQRRKARAGLALESHVAHGIAVPGMSFSRTPVTEGTLRPDFIFPGIREYRDPLFPKELLTMLAAKSTCKDSWRQILNEARRIPSKHLLTLEPGISINQTVEMRKEGVHLVIPTPLQATFMPAQLPELMSLAPFIGRAGEFQARNAS